MCTSISQVNSALERHLITVSSAFGFQAILTMNVTPATWAQAQDLGYTTLEAVEVNALYEAHEEEVGPRERMGFPQRFPETQINVDIKWV